jgi:hypothetical protein
MLSSSMFHLVWSAVSSRVSLVATIHVVLCSTMLSAQSQTLVMTSIRTPRYATTTNYVYEFHQKSQSTVSAMGQEMNIALTLHGDLVMSVLEQHGDTVSAEFTYRNVRISLHGGQTVGLSDTIFISKEPQSILGVRAVNGRVIKRYALGEINLPANLQQLAQNPLAQFDRLLFVPLPPKRYAYLGEQWSYAENDSASSPAMNMIVRRDMRYGYQTQCDTLGVKASRMSFASPKFLLQLDGEQMGLKLNGAGDGDMRGMVYVDAQSHIPFYGAMQTVITQNLAAVGVESMIMTVTQDVETSIRLKKAKQ